MTTRDHKVTANSSNASEIKAASASRGPTDESVALRRALEAARAEIEAARKEAEVAREAARKAERALQSEQHSRVRGDHHSREVGIGHRRLRLTQAARYLKRLAGSALRRLRAGRSKQIRSPSAASAVTTSVKEIDLFALRLVNPRGRLAVVLHLRDAAAWHRIESYLKGIVEPFDLFVTVVEGRTGNDAKIYEAFAFAHVLEFPDLGDTYTFVALINAGVLFNYDVVLKVRGDDVKTSTLVEPSAVLEAFDADPDLGIVTHDLDAVSADASCGEVLEEYCNRLGMRPAAAPADQRKPLGGTFWIRPFLLRLVRGLKLGAVDFANPLQRASTRLAVTNLMAITCSRAGMDVVDAQGVSTIRGEVVTPPRRLDIIAFYLPQFHPIPENNLWWGDGFTEWTNTCRATPKFRGHWQPRLPADLGFYDLRLAETRQAQASLARSYGVSAFCYYYYWFDGTPLLDHPINEVMRTGEPDFPFLLLWANEPWSRGWDGKPRDVLMPQNYKAGWVQGLAKSIAPIMQDSRYHRYLGQPVFLIYRIADIPDPRTSLRELRAALADLGIPRLHIAASWPNFPGNDPLPTDPTTLGLDAYFEFPPRALTDFRRRIVDLPGLDPQFQGRVFDYDGAVDHALCSLNEEVQGVRHRAVTMGWDNTPRRDQTSTIYYGATPAHFRRWLRGVVHHELETAKESEVMVFINAWNEWAEGTFLEPDQVFGRGWLEAVKLSIPQNRG